MNWYKNTMPTISDIKKIISQLCGDISNINGVNGVYIWGSYVKHQSNPSYPIKDIDIIVSTPFDTGDLLAIDNGKYSALNMHKDDLLDEGFNPAVVAFTKKYLTFEKYNVDHWALSENGKLLHWGMIADSKEEWDDINLKAEKAATVATGLSRDDLYKTSSENRKEWRDVYDKQTRMFLKCKNIGWCESEYNFSDIASETQKII